MKHINMKYIVAFSLLTLIAGSASASVNGVVGLPSQLQKSNPVTLGSDYKARRDHDKKLFLEKLKQKNKQKLVGFDTGSLSDFFKKLKEENKN